MPPGRSASATASTHSQGASMSRMTRSTALARAGQRLGQVADGQLPGRVARRRGRRTGSTLRRATSANSSRRSYDDTRPVRTDGAQQRAGQRAGADARLDDVGAGEDVGHARRSGRRPSGRPPPRRAASTPRTRDSSGRKTRYSPPGRRGDGEALLAADQLVVVEVAAVGEEPLARLQAEVVAPALAVGQPHPLARPQRAAVDAGPGLGRTSSASSACSDRSSLRRPTPGTPRSTSAVASTP